MNNASVKIKHGIKQARSEYIKLRKKKRAGELDETGMARIIALNKYLSEHDPNWRVEDALS